MSKFITRKELAEMYGVNRDTLNLMFKRHGLVPRPLNAKRIK